MAAFNLPSPYAKIVASHILLAVGLVATLIAPPVVFAQRAPSLEDTRASQTVRDVFPSASPQPQQPLRRNDVRYHLLQPLRSAVPGRTPARYRRPAWSRQSLGDTSAKQDEDSNLWWYAVGGATLGLAAGAAVLFISGGDSGGDDGLPLPPERP